MKKALSVIMALLLSISGLAVGSATAEEGSDWMKQLVLQLLGADGETANGAPAEEA